MDYVLRFIVITSVISLCGCDNDSSIATESASSSDFPHVNSQEENLKGVIPERHLDALEKAKGVEDLLQRVDDERRQSLKDSGL